MTESESFHTLITGRVFDSYQDGLISRWRAHRIEYSFTYGDLTEKPAIWMDYSTEEALARVTLWESGEAEFEILDIKTGKDILREQHVFPSPKAFFETYPRVPLLLQELRNQKREPSRPANPTPPGTSAAEQPRVPGSGGG